MYGYANSGNELTRYGFGPDRLYLSASAGVSFYAYWTNWRFGRRRFGQPIPIDTNSSHIDISMNGFGIPVQVQASYSPFDFFGIGMMLFADINSKKMNYGAAAMLQLYYF
jgi:hypothetical protein